MNVTKNLLNQFICRSKPQSRLRMTWLSNYNCVKYESTAASPAMKNSSPHLPVLLNEVLFYLDAKPGETIVDMTFGSGGHSRKLLETVPDIRIFGLDRDPVGFSYAQKLAKEYPGQVVPLLGRFSEIKTLLLEHDVTTVDGMLFDLGCSSMQFDDPTRGFGVSFDAPLDMRMDGQRFPDAPTGADVLRHIEEHDLFKILRVYGEEILAKKISKAVIESRYMFQTLETTTEFAALVASVVEKDTRFDKLSRSAHSATKSFQGLRIFVNNELNEINRGIELAHKLLKPQGTVVALTFHSLEDRIVKRHFVGIDMDDPVEQTLHQKYINAMNVPTTLFEVESVYSKKWSVVTKHVVNPTVYETHSNPRSRSAKLRCATKNE